MSEAAAQLLAVLLLLAVAPLAITVLVAILRGYRIHLDMDRRRPDPPDDPDDPDDPST